MLEKSKVLLILMVPAVILLIKLWVVQIFIVQGNSMIPGLHHADLVLVSKLGFEGKIPFSNKNFALFKKDYHSSDLLVFLTPENDSAVKRVIGLPGDFYKFTDSEIYINDTLLIEPYITRGDNYLNSLTEYAPEGLIAVEKEGRIPPGYILLLGDNRPNSSDSRFFGLVPESRVSGKVILKF